MLEVRPVTPDLRAAVLALRVLPEQARFSGEMPEVLEAAESLPLSQLMAVLEDGRVVGFYRLDLRLGAIAGRDFGVPSVGLRAFFIDAACQGRGLGTRAMAALVADLQARYPDLRVLALGVNAKNPAALHVYERVGFVRDPEPYLGGSFGPQHVMTLRLDDPAR